MVKIRMAQQNLNGFKGLPVGDQASHKRTATGMNAVTRSEACGAVRAGDIALQTVGGPLFHRFAVEVHTALHAQFKRPALLREDNGKAHQILAWRIWRPGARHDHAR